MTLGTISISASVPLQLQGTELDVSYKLLKLFCYGTWQEFKGELPSCVSHKYFLITHLPDGIQWWLCSGLTCIHIYYLAGTLSQVSLSKQQQLKLKQLTVVSLAAQAKVKRPESHCVCAITMLRIPTDLMHDYIWIS